MSNRAILIVLAAFIWGFCHLGFRDTTEVQPDGTVIEVVNPDLTATDQLAVMVTIISGLILYAACPVFRVITNVVIGVIVADALIKKLSED